MGKQCKHIIPSGNAYANKLIYGLYFITSYSLIAAYTIYTLSIMKTIREYMSSSEIIFF